MIDSDAPGTPRPDRIVFAILGPLELVGAGGRVRIPPGRQEAVLACLLMNVGRVISADHLVDLLWETEPPDTARTQVQICVSRLRKILARAGVSAAILSRQAGYLLQADDGALDLNVFRDGVAQARALANHGGNAEAAELLRAALAVWRGPCLSGIGNEELLRRAHRIDEERLTVTETYLELELGRGLHDEVVAEIDRLVHENPFRERLRAQLMLALYRSGRQAEALEVYRNGQRMFVEELGLQPGEELRALQAAILAGDKDLRLGGAGAGAGAGTAEPEPPASPVPRTGHDPATADPEPAIRAVTPHQLPTDAADFVGRDLAMKAIEAAIGGQEAHQAVGLVVVIGKPGIGKTTVATHIAHRLSARYFPDGQLYCDLRGATAEPVAPAEVLGRFLRALGIPGQMVPDSLDERAEMYRTLLSTRQVLVLLDDAATERQIGPLLPGSSTCAVLVTSRGRLTALPGAQRVDLEILEDEQATELLRKVVGPARIAQEPEATAALIALVGGLPLALRIVAARLAARPHWTLASMVARLADAEHPLDELAHGDEPGRQLMRLLSLADGPTFPGWLAGALIDDHRPVPGDLLEPIIDVQMLDVVLVKPSGELTHRFHELIRLFAREQLARYDSAEVRRAAIERMAGGWLSLAEQAHARIYGGDYTTLHGGAARWRPPDAQLDLLLADPLEWLDSELDNLCRTVELAAEAGLDELCWDLAVTLVTLFEARGYLEHWESTHQVALDAARRAGNERGTAALLSSLGTLYMSRRQPEEARTSLEAAQRIFSRLDDRHGLAMCRRDLALLERQRGDDDRALVLYERAVRDFEVAGDVVGRATALTQSAQIWMRRGYDMAAEAQLGEALAIFRAAGYERGEAHALRREGQLQLQRGAYDQAEETFVGVLAMVRHSGDVIGEGYLLRDLGESYAAQGQDTKARECFDRALAVRAQIMDSGGVAAIRLDVARLLDRAGRRDEADELLRQAIPVFSERGMLRELRLAQQLADDIALD